MAGAYWGARSLPDNPHYSASEDPKMGTIIPSPLMSHLYAVVPFPFDPSNIFNTPLFYLPEHATYADPAVVAGQRTVVTEMAKLARAEKRAHWLRQQPELVVPNVAPGDLEPSTEWRKRLGWRRSEDPTLRKQNARYITTITTKPRLLSGYSHEYAWSHAQGLWLPNTSTALETDHREGVCSELERIDELRYTAEERLRTPRLSNSGVQKQKRKRTPIDVSSSSKRQRVDTSSGRATNNGSNAVDVSSARVPPRSTEPEVMLLNREAVITQDLNQNPTTAPQRADAVTYANRDVGAPGHSTIENTSQVAVPAKATIAREGDSPEIAHSFESTVHTLPTAGQNAPAPVDPQEIADSTRSPSQDGAQSRAVNDEMPAPARHEASPNKMRAPPLQKTQPSRKRKQDSSRSTIRKATPKSTDDNRRTATPASIIEWDSLPPSARASFVGIRMWVGQEKKVGLGTLGLAETATMKTLMHYVCEREDILGMDFDFWLESCKFRTRDTPSELGLEGDQDCHVTLPRSRLVRPASKAWYTRKLGGGEVKAKKRLKGGVGDEGESDVSPTPIRAGKKKAMERVLGEAAGKVARKGHKKSQQETSKTAAVDLTEVPSSTSPPPPPPQKQPARPRSRSQTSAAKPTPSAEQLSLEAGFGDYTFLNGLPEADRRAWVDVLKNRSLGKGALEGLGKTYEVPRSGEYTRGVIARVVRRWPVEEGRGGGSQEGGMRGMVGWKGD